MHSVNARTDSPLRTARRRAGLSMEALAVKAGISRSILYLAEKAPGLMSDRTACAVAIVLGCKPEEFRP